MNLIDIDINKLIPYANNPRKNNEAVDPVANSIREFGFKVPIVVDTENNVVCGHTRLKAAKKLGMKTVPCIIADDLSEEQIKAFRLAENKVGELAEWDFDLLGDELDSIFDIDMSEFGFELNLDDEEPQEIVEDEVPEEVETRCKLGDLWQLGEHRLICGDSTDVNVIDRLMDGVKADMVFTDPPYRMDAQGGSNQWVGRQAAKLGESIKDLCDFDPVEFLKILPTIFANNMNAYIFCNKDLVPDYLNWSTENRYAFNILFWKKPSALPLGGQHRPDTEYLLYFRKNALWNNGLKDVSYSKCLEFSRDNTTDHPTMKPIGLIANELKISSNNNSVVVDFFGGSGSTLIACEQLNRKCYMAELDPKYVSVILQRYINFKGSDEDVFLLKDGKKIPYSEVE